MDYFKINEIMYTPKLSLSCQHKGPFIKRIGKELEQ